MTTQEALIKLHDSVVKVGVAPDASVHERAFFQGMVHGIKLAIQQTRGLTS